MLRFTQNLSAKTYILSMLLIFFLSLIFLGLLHYLVNIQYVKSNKYSLRGPVTTAPVLLTLEVTAPDDNLIVFNSPFLITGSSNPKTHVLVSSETTDEVVLSGADGTFSISFPLTEGPNTITIAAFNQKGEDRSLTRAVYYSKEKL